MHPSLKYSKDYLINPLIKNSIFITFSQIFDTAIGFVFWMVAARVYNIEDVGLATALFSALSLVILLSRLGSDVSIIRFNPIYGEKIVLGSMLFITSIVAVIIAIIYLIIAKILLTNGLLQWNYYYMAVFVLVALFNSITSTTESGYLASKRSDLYFYQHLIMGVRLVFLLPLIFMGYIGIFGAMGLSYAIAALFAFSLLANKGILFSLDFDRDFINDSFRFSLWSYMSNILSTAPALLLPIIVLSILGEAEAGNYYISFSIACLVTMVPIALATSILVEGSHGKPLKQMVIKAVIISMLVAVPASLCLIIFGDKILGLLRPEYIDGFPLMRIIAITNFLVIFYVIFVSIQRVRMNVVSVFSLGLIRGILLLCLSYLFLNRFGLIGIGYAWLITYSIICVIILIIIGKNGWFKSGF